MKPNARPSLVACVAASIGFVACEGSELVRPIDKSATHDVVDDGDGNEVVGTGLDFWFLTANGPKGADSDQVALAIADEPIDYRQMPQFQVNIGVAARTALAGSRARLYVDDTAVAVVDLLDVGGVPTATFSAVTLPVRAAGVPVRVEATDAAGSPIVREKTVTLAYTGCTVEAKIAENDLQCAVTRYDVSLGLTVAVDVTLIDGPCDAAGLEVVFGTDTTRVGPIAFDETKVAHFDVVLAPGAGPAIPVVTGALQILAVATVTADPVTGGAVELTSTVDSAAPPVDLVAPTATGGTITLDDDFGGDPTDGLQYAVRFSSDLVEPAHAVLTLDGTIASEMDIAPNDSAEFQFPAVTLTQNGPVVFAVSLSDACGNKGTVTAQVLVLSSAGHIGIVAPADASTLLARDDTDAATATVFDGTFDILTTGAQVGATLGIWCAPAASVDPADLVQVGARTIAAGGVAPNGRYKIPVAIDVAAFGQEVHCVARIDLPASAESTAVALTIALPAPTLLVDAPVSDACLNATHIDVAGTATGLDGQSVLVDLGTGTATTLNPVAAGAWSGSVNLAANAPDGVYALGFDSTDALGNIVSDTSGPIAVSVVLDRSKPVLAVTAPETAIDAAVTPDESGTVAGYQTTARATITDAHVDGASACLVVNGGTPTCIEVGADGAAEWSLVTLTSGPNTLTYTVTDTCGNASVEVTRLVTLTQTTPIAIVTPTDGTTLRAADDGDPATARIFEGDVVVDSDSAAAGAAIKVACRTNAAGALFVDVGTFTIATVAADGRYTVPVAIDTASLGTDVVCQATVDLPFAGVSATIGLRVGLPAPTLGVTTPTIGACATAATLAVSGVATGLDGQSVAGTLGTGNASGTVAAGAYALAIPVPSGADGPATLTVSGVDTFGNHADASVALLVDRTAPTLTYEGPTSPLDPATTPDADPIAPGYQTTVSATLVDLLALGGQVCLAVNGGSVTCVDIGDTSGVVSFAGVTLQSGDNTLAFTMTDGCGNAGAPSTQTVSLVTSTPTVAITTPASDLVTTAASADLTATVALSGTPLTGASVTLTKNGTLTAFTPVDHGDGTYTFTAVPLTAGSANVFIISATPAAGGGTGASSPRTVTQKNVLPTIAVTAPADGTINLATAACAAGQANCVMTVTAATTNAEDGSVTGLAVDCDGAATSYSGVVNAGVTSFAAVVLTNGTGCTLTASVTDAAAQTASSAPVTVSVDRSAPVLDITSPSGPLQNTSDLAPGTAGIQAPLLVDVAGLEAGQTVDVVLTWTDAGGPQTKSYTATATGTDGVIAMEEFAGAGWVTWPEGLITITASAEDLAGNVGTDVASEAVSSTGDVRITSPVAVADACAGTCATGVCNAGACWRTWGSADSRQLVAAPAGMTTSAQNIRVCSDEPSLAATGAVVCASTPSATGPYRQVSIGNTSGAVTVLDLSASLPAGFQRLVVEVMPIAGGGWISSLGTSNAAERVRRVDVDVSAPSVSGLGSPSDTLAPNGTLNAAEQFTSPRVYQIAFTPSEAARAEVFVQGASALVQDVTATPTIVQVTLPEGTPQVWVVLTDSVGNHSPPTPATGAVTYQPTVDVTPPTLSFARPNTSPLHGGDNLDVVLTSNAEGRTATVRDAGVDVASAAIASGAATFAHATFHILSDGTHTLTATVSDAAGNPANAATSPASVVVDAVPPVGTITDPVELDTFTDADDADPAPGFQVRVTFTTAGATSWTLLTANGCDATWSGCAAPAQQATGAVTNPGGAEPAQLVTVDLEAALTFKKFILRTTDAGGNTASTEVDVSFAVSACTLAFTNLPSGAWYNMTACPGGTPCASTSVSIDVQLTGACALSELRLLSGGATVGTIPTPAGTETFILPVADAAHLSLEAKGFSGASEIASTGVRVRDADFTPPSVQFVSQTVNGFTTTAEGANTTYNVANDLLPSTAGMQLHAAVRVTDTNAASGRIESISAAGASGTTSLTPSNVTLPVTLAGASPITQNLLDLSLADNDTYTVTVTGSDAAGNTDTSSYVAKVDVTAPAEVPISSITMQQRRPRANQFRWTTVGDDGNTNGPVARYEIHYSFQPIDASNWDAACKGSDVWGSNALPAPVAAGTVQGSLVGAPDTRSITDPCKLPVFFEANVAPTDPAMYMAIRAVDDAGNWSPLGAQSVRAVANQDIWMRLTRIRFDNTGGTLGIDPNFLTFRGAVLGDVNGDNNPDWAVGSSNSNGVCVVLGHAVPLAGETISTPTGANHTCATGADVAALIPNAAQFGANIEPLGDINGDTIGDFAITGKVASGSPNEGFAFIYLGKAGLPTLTDPAIIVRGLDASASPFTAVCGAGNFNGLGPVDFAVGEPFSNRINVFPGNATWSAVTLTGAARLVINLDTAGTLAANGGMSFTFTGPAGAGFGARCGMAGDILATPAGLGTGAKGDLIVNSTGADNGRVFLFPGREWTAGDVFNVSQNVPVTGATPEDLRSLRLRQESDNPQAGFGANFQGNVDFTNDAIPDVLVTIHNRSFDNAGGANPDGKATYIFDGAKLGALVGGDVRVDIAANPRVGDSWTGTNGWVLYSSVYGEIRSARAIGDFNQQNTGNPSRPTVDLAISNFAGDTVQVRMNHPRPGVNVLGQFSIVDGLFENIYNDAANGVGTWMDAAGDLTGDGQPDFIVGSVKGDVLIIR